MPGDLAPSGVNASAIPSGGHREQQHHKQDGAFLEGNSSCECSLAPSVHGCDQDVSHRSKTCICQSVSQSVRLSPGGFALVVTTFSGVEIIVLMESIFQGEKKKRGVICCERLTSIKWMNSVLQKITSSYLAAGAEDICLSLNYMQNIAERWRRSFFCCCQKHNVRLYCNQVVICKCTVQDRL